MPISYGGLNSEELSQWERQKEKLEATGYAFNDSGSVAATDQKGNLVRIGSVMFISKVRQNLQTNQVFVEVLFYMQNREEWVRVTMQPDILTRTGLNKLQSVGADIRNLTADMFLEMLESMYRDAPFSYFAAAPGWYTIKEKQHYISSRSYGAKRITAESDQGRFKTKPTGDLSKYLSMLQMVTSGNVNLQVAAAIGLASLLVTLLFRFGKMVTAVLFASFVGESTTGKTTSAMLAASIHGYVGAMVGSLMGSWSGTPLSRTMKYADVHGMLLVLDELGTAGNFEDLSGLIYSFSNGTERDRGTPDGTLQDKRTWSGAIISTSEFPLRDKMDKMTGLNARYLEFNNTQWTRSADEANLIRETVKDNHGLLADAFLTWVFETKGYDAFFEELLVVFDEAQQKAQPLIADEKLSSRVSQNVAAIVAGSHFLKEAFPELSHFDSDAVLEAVISQTKSQFTVDSPVEKAQSQITQSLIARSGSIGVLRGPDNYNPNGMIGFVDGKRRLTEADNVFHVYVASGEVESVLRRNGHNNPRTTLKALEKAGFVVRADDDRQQVRKTVDGIRKNYYQFALPVELLNLFPAVQRGIEPLDENSGISDFGPGFPPVRSKKPNKRLDAALDGEGIQSEDDTPRVAPAFETPKVNEPVRPTQSTTNHTDFEAVPPVQPGELFDEDEESNDEQED